VYTCIPIVLWIPWVKFTSVIIVGAHQVEIIRINIVYKRLIKIVARFIYG